MQNSKLRMTNFYKVLISMHVQKRHLIVLIEIRDEKMKKKQDEDGLKDMVPTFLSVYSSLQYHSIEL